MPEAIGQPAQETRRKLEPIQWVGMWLFVGVLLIIAGTTVVLFMDFWTHVPKTPDLTQFISPQGFNKEQVREVLDEYKRIRDIVKDGDLVMFENIVTKVLFPLLTSIAGYIFAGRRQ